MPRILLGMLEGLSELSAYEVLRIDLLSVN